MSLKDQIVAAADCQREKVIVPEWNLESPLYIRSLTAQDIDSWQAETYQVNGTSVEINKQNIRARLVIRCLVDESGQRVFSDGEAHLLGAKNNKVVERLYKTAERLNAVTPEDIELLAKN